MEYRIQVAAMSEKAMAVDEKVFSHHHESGGLQDSHVAHDDREVSFERSGCTYLCLTLRGRT